MWICEGTVGDEGVCRLRNEGKGKDSGSGEFSNAPPAYRNSGDNCEGKVERLAGSLDLLGLLVIGVKLVGKGTGLAT
jgi:hypothetical protein